MNAEDVSSPSRSLWGCGIGFLSVPILVLVNHFTDPGRGMAAALAFALMVFAVQAHWDSRRQVWFWVTIMVLIFVHLILVLVVPWPNMTISGPVFAPFGVAYFLSIYWCFRLVKKLMTRHHGTTSSS
jgi:uncharacterized membrane protein YfcA